MKNLRTVKKIKKNDLSKGINTSFISKFICLINGVFFVYIKVGAVNNENRLQGFMLIEERELEAARKKASYLPALIFLQKQTQYRET